MSLNDPIEFARRREKNFKGSAGALCGTLITGLAALITMAVLGFGVGGFVDQLRVMQLNSVFSTWETEIPVALRSFAIPVGVLASIVCFGLYTKWNHRYTGRRTYYAVVGPLTIGLFGLAAGTWFATTMWVAPDAVGIALDPTFHQDEAWGVGAWVLYAAKWWLPGVFALLGALSLTGRLSTGKYRARNSELAAELLRGGRVVSAEVVKSQSPVTDAARVATTAVFRFEDAEGRNRWVKCPMLLPPSELPRAGELRPLVFDPREPENTKRIFVSPTGRLEPDDFLPVRRP